ncbi:MAG: (Fe-S)-binding protein [Methanothrix sp.]|nr:(Fe-S)-binding protein [Methanothrix sp.]
MAELTKILPGYNCGECGHRQCKDYAEEISIKRDFSKCPHLELERFIDTKAEIREYLSTHIVVEEKVEDFPLSCQGCGEGITGLKSDRKADFSLGPIPGEPSCREDLYPFGRTADIMPGDVLRYRALGCPVIHFARVMRYNQGIATVHLAGPHQLLSDEFHYKDVGICMVTSFEGSVNHGRIPDVGETVKFLPSHCRMQQVHSGVIVLSEGNKLRIEGIDLKVWR